MAHKARDTWLNSALASSVQAGEGPSKAGGEREQDQGNAGGECYQDPGKAGGEGFPHIPPELPGLA